MKRNTLWLLFPLGVLLCSVLWVKYYFCWESVVSFGEIKIKNNGNLSNKIETISSFAETENMPQEEIASLYEDNPESISVEIPSVEEQDDSVRTSAIMTEEESKEKEAADQICESLSNRLDDGDEINALAEARTLIFSTNRDVRKIVADALEWIGTSAAMDAATMMDDPDEDIREQMQSAFWDMLDEVNDPELKKSLLATALQSQDADVRRTVLDELLNLPDTLSFDLIAGSMTDPVSTVAELARENIEFISGEEFSTYEAAMKWFEANKDDLISE